MSSGKPSLSFYTNIPTPYQLDFFDALARHFELSVYYFAPTESNRSWQLKHAVNYKTTFLENNFIARIIQRKVNDFHFSWSIFQVLMNDKSDFVIAGGSYWIPNTACTIILSKLRKKRVAYFTEPLFPVQHKLKSFAKWLMLRHVQYCCDAIFCIGEKAAHSFNQYNVSVPKYTIPYSINVEKFKMHSKDTVQAFCKKLKQDGSLIFLTSGALVHRKGIDILIDALALIPYIQVKLLIIGDGPEKNVFKKMADHDARIVFAGEQHTEDSIAYFNAADAFIFASRYDGWGVVINEAIAARLPIICSNAVGAAQELLIHKDTAIICRSENVADFAEAIVLITKDTELRNNLKENVAALIPAISAEQQARYVYNIFTKELSAIESKITTA